MHSAFWKKLVLASLVSALVVSAISLNSVGQDAKKADPKAKAGAKEKAKGRLPAYYKDVVTDEQRDQIYALQAKYAKQLEDLQTQIDGVKGKLNGEIEALLSPEQKEKLAKVKEEAEAKKKGGKKGDGDKGAKPDAEKKTTESEKKPK
jgi:Spy/CpxP family protein refolding chaperone